MRKTECMVCVMDVECKVGDVVCFMLGTNLLGYAVSVVRGLKRVTINGAFRQRIEQGVGVQSVGGGMLQKIENDFFDDAIFVFHLYFYRQSPSSLVVSDFS